MRIGGHALGLVLLVLLAILSILWLIALRNGTDESSHVDHVSAVQSDVAVSIGNESQNKSLLFMTASYSFDQFTALQKVLDSLRDICNAGWNVVVHLDISSKGMDKNHPSASIIRDRMYCVRTQSYIPLVIDSYGTIGFGLNSKHRAYAAKHLQEFDYFVYAEEDMLLTISHLSAFIDAMYKVRLSLPDTWLRYQMGFLRYEDSVVGTIERVTWEYMPHQVHVVELKDSSGVVLGKYVFTNNLNQAIYIFPREQLIDLENRCEFLSRPGQNPFYTELRRAQNKDWKYMSVGVSEWSSSFQQVLQCGLRRLIPADHFQLFMIHHTTNKAQKRRLRRELLTMQNWTDLVAEKSQRPITLQHAQHTILPEQYNLHLMDLDSIRGKVKWSWE